MSSRINYLRVIENIKEPRFLGSRILGLRFNWSPLSRFY